MKKEETKIRDNMGIADKFRGGDRRRTNTAEEMRDNMDIGDGNIRIWRRQKWQRHRIGDRRDAGTTDFAVLGQ